MVIALFQNITERPDLCRPPIRLRKDAIRPLFGAFRFDFNRMTQHPDVTMRITYYASKDTIAESSFF